MGVKKPEYYADFISEGIFQKKQSKKCYKAIFGNLRVFGGKVVGTIFHQCPFISEISIKF
jgi:hypothetical protein